MQCTERIQRFVEEIWRWYTHHKRTLPWRDLAIEDDTQRAYMILVSEVMLQQTQVVRVQIIFKQFIERFPTIKDLARASNRDVLIAWRGMGYNSRALRLRDAAKMIVGRPLTLTLSRGEREFPRSMKELLSIPGIGPYTAAAIRNFAFNFPTPCIDTNIRRILHRTFIGPENRDGTWKRDDAYLLKLAEEVLRVALDAPHPNPLPRGEGIFSASSPIRCDTANWHAALMDFGSLIQTKSNPKWHLCPLIAAGIMKATPHNFPKSPPKPARRRHADGRPKSLGLAGQAPREPGRMVGSKFIPNRIFRGRAVELLRDAPGGMTLEVIGRNICLDWSQEHRSWLQKILTTLQKDSLLKNQGKKYVLS